MILTEWNALGFVGMLIIEVIIHLALILFYEKAKSKVNSNTCLAYYCGNGDNNGEKLGKFMKN